MDTLTTNNLLNDALQLPNRLVKVKIQQLGAASKYGCERCEAGIELTSALQMSPGVLLLP